MRNGEYLMVVAPDDYPGYRYRGRYVYEHRLVWWKHTGQVAPEGWVLHHRNHDKHDNRIENLELLEAGAHTKLHTRPKEMMAMICAFCEAPFQLEARQFRSRGKHYGQKKFCCSVVCAGRLKSMGSLAAEAPPC